MKNIIGIILLLGSFFLLVSLNNTIDNIQISGKDNVSSILEKLGDKPLPHKVNEVKGTSVENGRNIVLNGFSKSMKGKKSAKQSKHFVCTSCHNVVKEDPDLSVSDPQARLEYAHKNNLPFLQGSSLYGAVNRTSFYNDDYFKKYGDLVDKARNNLRASIQLCATECAQGRALKNWEIESVLAYLWTLEFKIDDIDLSEEELKAVNDALNDNGDKEAAVKLIKSKYLSGSPATFAPPPENRKTGLENLKGDPENGKLVYQLSCQHCHEAKRYSFFELDNSKTTFNYLKKHFSKYTRYSVYQVVRYGTPPLAGKKAYMPQYPLQKLSEQQLADLRAYINWEAER